MSIGNLKTSGDKGNNFPFQLKVLQGLQCTCNSLQVVETNTTGVVRRPNLLRVNDPNDLAAFAPLYSVSVANVGLADGIVLGGALRPGEVVNFSADALNNFFSSFIVDATGTEFIITFIN
jgi:hypothetical protein